MKVYAASVRIYKDVQPLGKLLQENSTVATDHGTVGRFNLSYNQDEKRFYVRNKDGMVVAVFAERRNAVYYARTH